MGHRCAGRLDHAKQARLEIMTGSSTVGPCLRSFVGRWWHRLWGLIPLCRDFFSWLAGQGGYGINDGPCVGVL